MNPEKLHIGFEAKNVIRPLYLGGMERVLQRLTDELARRNHGITVFTGRNFRDFSGSAEVIREERKEIRYFADTHDLMLSLTEDADSGHIQVVHFNSIWGLNDDLELFRMIYKIKTPVVWLSGGMNLFRDFPYPEEMTRFANFVDKFVMVSAPIAEEAISCGIPKEKIQVIYPPVDLNIFRPASGNMKEQIRTELGIPPDKKVLLHAGRFIEAKGTDFLIEAWKDITDPDLHLLLVGGPIPQNTESFKERVQRLIEKGLSVSWTGGFVHDEKELAKYYQASDVFVCPTNDEGIGIVFLEAGAAGLPVVAWDGALDHTGVRDVLVRGVNCTTIRHHSSRELLSAIQTATPNMGSNNLNKVKSMGVDIKTVADQYEQLYTHLTHGSPYSIAFGG